MSRSALGQRWDLFWMLTRTEFRMRDQGTLLGFLWTLLHPLFHFAILYALFTNWMGRWVENYPAYLLIGIVQWNFFATATHAGLTSLRRKAGLISNFSLPHVFIVLSSVFSVLISHLLEWAIVLAGLCWMGVPARAGWLCLPGLVAAELALIVAVSAGLSVLSAGVRDADRGWEIAVYGLFFLTPVFYSSEIVAGVGSRLLAVNPLAVVLGATRAALLGGPWPHPGAVLGVCAAAVICCAFSLALFPLFSRGVAERL